MVKRKTLYTVIIRLTGKQADLLAQAAIKGMKALKDRIKTTTFDNGLEFSEHEKWLKPWMRIFILRILMPPGSKGSTKIQTGLSGNIFPRVLILIR
jgi:hypothetical protein